MYPELPKSIEIEHLSGFLLKGVVTEPYLVSIDDAPFAPLPAYGTETPGRYRFYLAPSAPLLNGTTVKLYASGTGIGHTLVVARPELSQDDELRALSLGLHTGPDWAIDNVEVVDGTVTFSGWILIDPSLSTALYVNDRPCSITPVSRPDIDAVFSHLQPFRCWTGFTATAPIEAGAASITFRLTQREALEYAFSISANSAFPVPSASQIERVNGKLGTGGFNRAGFSHYERIARMVEAVGVSSRPKSIMDWGCGCGGLARFFLQDKRFDYFGCDIDHDNLDWCRQHLAADRFFQLPLDPPAGNPFGRKFDVIFGVSVISHLAPETVRTWLAWLSTLLSDSGVVVLSTLSTQALSKIAPSNAFAVLSGGASFFSDRTGIGDIINNQSYYGIAYQMPATLAQLAAPALRITHHIPAGFSHQDLFVFRKPLV